MTDIVKVKKKAQVTIPKKVREKLGIEEGDILELKIEKEAIVLAPQITAKIVLGRAPANSLKKLAGVIKIGGDALKESEKIYEE